MPDQALASLSAHDWPTLALWAALGLLSLIVSRRSQVDGWAEANPKVAGVLKLFRGLGLDPWLVIQGLTLLVKGRLPKQPEPPAEPRPPEGQ